MGIIGRANYFHSFRFCKLFFLDLINLSSESKSNFQRQILINIHGYYISVKR